MQSKDVSFVGATWLVNSQIIRNGCRGYDVFSGEAELIAANIYDFPPNILCRGLRADFR